MQVTNLIWAFAKLSVPCAPLYQSLASTLTQQQNLPDKVYELRNAAKMLQARQRGEYKASCCRRCYKLQDA